MAILTTTLAEGGENLVDDNIPGIPLTDDLPSDLFAIGEPKRLPRGQVHYPDGWHFVRSLATLLMGG